MALPPKIIKLKRKRVEDPVDTLHIKKERDAPSAGRTGDHQWSFKRLRDEADLGAQEIPGSIIDRSTPGAHSRASTSAEGEGVTLHSDTGGDKAHLTAPAPALPPKQRPLPDGATGQTLLRPKRVFHLSKERSSSNLRRSPSASSLGGIHKRRRGPHGTIAVFSEQKKSNLKKLVSSESLSKLSDGAEAQILLRGPETVRDDQASNDQTQPRKRPTASEAERKWRQENWAKPSAADAILPDVHIGGDSSDDPSLTLAAELQQFAMQETLNDARATPPTAASIEAGNDKPRPETDAELRARQRQGAKPLRFQPKTPPPRVREPQPESTADDDSESEWVYDTYIREPNLAAHPDPDEMAIDSSRPTAQKLETVENVGYIVIRTEDEEAWEEFMSDGDGSEEENWEDDDDSNAEDYYGNDYPDEEGDWEDSGYVNDSESYGSQDDEWPDEPGRHEEE